MASTREKLKTAGVLYKDMKFKNIKADGEIDLDKMTEFERAMIEMMIELRLEIARIKL